MYDQHYQKPWTGLKSTQKHNYREIYIVNSDPLQYFPDITLIPCHYINRPSRDYKLRLSVQTTELEASSELLIIG